jgi:DNA polymerase III epsilon subunit-like protein
MELSYPKSYIAWDLETSGLDKNECKILEIGAIRVVDGEIMEEKSWMLNHGIEIPEVITGITGITKDIIDREGRDPGECLQEFLEFLDPSYPNLTHNGFRFDIPFLVTQARDTISMSEEEASDMLKRLNRYCIDTAVMVKANKLKEPRAWNENFIDYATRIMNIRAFGVKYNVAICCQEMQIDTKDVQQHRALGDVNLTHKIYQNLIKAK